MLRKMIDVFYISMNEKMIQINDRRRLEEKDTWHSLVVVASIQYISPKMDGK